MKVNNIMERKRGPRYRNSNVSQKSDGEATYGITNTQKNPSYVKFMRLNSRVNTRLSEINSNSEIDMVLLYDLDVFNPQRPAMEIPEEIAEETKKELLKDYIKIREKTRYETIDELYDSSSQVNSIEIYNAVLTIKASISELSELITKNFIFESFIILLITANTFTIAMDSIYSIPKELDTVFLICYSVECLLKIFCAGFILNQGSYLRDKWNILDFIIVLTGWINMLNVKLNILRAFRILRPLRSISSVKGMKAIFIALVKAARPLVGTLGVLVFFILVFSIVGLETMMGSFLYRCMYLDTGIYGPDTQRCGNFECPEGMVCVKSLDNPNFGVSSFDNIFWAVIIVFECVTLQTWVPLMNIAESTINYWTILYFLPISFIGAFLILNLSLAVIKSAFTKSMEKIKLTSVNNDNDEEILDYSIEAIENPQKIVETQSPQLDTENYTREKILELQEEIVGNYLANNENRIEKPKSRSKSHEIRYSVVNTHKLESIRQPHTYRTQIQNEIIIQKGKRRNSLLLTFKKEKSSKSRRIQNIDDHSPTSLSLEGQNRRIRENTARSGATSGIGKTIISKDSKIGSFNTIDHSPEQKFRSLMHTVKIRRDIIKKIKKGVDIGELKMVVSEGLGTYSESITDVSPIPEGFEAILNTVKSSNFFVYKDDTSLVEDELEKKWRSDYEAYFNLYLNLTSPFQIFNRVSLKFGKDQGFQKLMGNVLEKIRCVDMEDDITGRVEGYWSGNDVQNDHPRNHHFYKSLSNMKCYIWSKGLAGRFEKVQFVAKAIESNKWFILPMLLLVIVNAFVLALDYYGISSYRESILENINTACTIIFTCEILVKFIGLGPRVFCRDSMNYVDAILIVLSWIEIMVIVGTSALTAFRVIRVFRIFRVARITRVFRYFTFMKSLIVVITYSLPKFIYLALLLLLLNMIYALLGYQLFAGGFGHHEELPRSNFENFGWAYLTVFQILTLSSYSEVLYELMHSTAGPWSALYVFVWIIIGNFILLNLFIAILLDSFMEENNENETVHTMTEQTISINKSTLFSESSARNSKKREIEKMKILGAINIDENTNYYENNDILTMDCLGCEKSYLVFSKSNRFRNLCFLIMNSKIFSRFIFFIIYLNCLTIVWETYTLNLKADNLQVIIITKAELSYTIVYLCEFIIKSISLGLFTGDYSYFRSSWNTLDFLILSVSLLDAFTTFFSFTLIKLFRVVRAIRPLRFISKNEALKTLVSALFSSLSAILNVIIILFVVWFMFAVLGVSIFSGKMYTCQNELYESEVECLEAGFSWVNAPSNFDNVLEAFSSLFVMCLLEGWHAIMYNCIDARGRGISRSRDYNIAAAYYCLFFLVIGSFFFLHLFMGVVFLKFHQAKKQDHSWHTLFLTNEQQIWANMQKLIVKSSPTKEISKEPDHFIRKILHKVARSMELEVFILSCVVLNMICMAISYRDAPESYLTGLEIANVVFVLIFTIEASIKILAFGGKKYFRSKWNIFDFLAVLAAYIDIFMTLEFMMKASFIRTGPQIFRIFRIFRVSRLFRIFKPLKTLNNLISIVRHALSQILSVASMLMLIIFIFSVLGVFLFSGVTKGKVINDFNNFQNFLSAAILLLRCSTGGDWFLFMYDCIEVVGGPIAVTYFALFMSISIMIILNLFIMVIIQNYEDFESNPNNYLHIFVKDERKFKKEWEKYSELSGGIKMHYKDLLNFMFGLGNRIGLDENTTFDEGIHILSKMSFVMNEDGEIYYNDLLYAILRRKYGIFPEDCEKVSAILLRKEEYKTVNKLRDLRDSSEGRLLSKMKEGNDINLYKKKKSRNIMIDLLYTRKIFSAWKRVTRDIKTKRINNSQLLIEDDIF